MRCRTAAFQNLLVTDSVQCVRHCWNTAPTFSRVTQSHTQ